MLDREVSSALEGGCASGGTILERLQASGSASVKGRGALVYAALAHLAADGGIDVRAEGPGERLWGKKGAMPGPLKPPGHAPSFSLSATDLEFADKRLRRMTRGLPPFYFEELRRVVVADADRRVFGGERLPRALLLALEDLGPESSVRKMLRTLERGKRIPRSLPRGAHPGPWFAALALVAAFVLLRLFVFGIYRVSSDSMAPTLLPAADGGDDRVIVNLLAYSGSPPRRGDLVAFYPPGSKDRYVKRVMGLAGERIRIGGGDLFVNGKRLVKGRPLLDRLAVPMFFEKDFSIKSDPERFVQPGPLTAGYRWSDGSLQGDHRQFPEMVVSLTLRTKTVPSTVAILLDSGTGPPDTVVLGTAVYGAGAALAGIEVASGPDFLLRLGVARKVWVTNADHLFRVQIDGKEVARAPIARYGSTTRCTVRIDQGPVEVQDLVVSRDACYDQVPGEGPAEGGKGGAEGGQEGWKVPPDACFVLGDNSADSRDSRYFGPIPFASILGRPFAVVWPLSRLRRLK